MKKSVFLFAMIVGISLLASASTGAEAPYTPEAVYLTWVDDPATTMTVHWHSTNPEERRTLQYRAQGSGDEAWRTAGSWTRPMHLSDRTIHMALLAGLTPDTGYDFRFGEDSARYAFRTMPATASTPIVFAAGGDTAPLPAFRALCEQVAKRNPRFAVIGGDLAYADGRYVDRWYAWFDIWTDTMVTSDGFLIPVIVGIGNHEVEDRRYFRDGGRFEMAPFFYSLFAFPGLPGYKALDFGNYLSLIVLDSGHTNGVEGPQAAWLEDTLAARRHITFNVPIYHVPAYPSNRNFDGSLQTEIRETWVPIFDRHHVRVAFEHHDHTYKRTPPLRGNEVDENGVVYVGDGAWGVPVREVHPPAETWYLERAESVQHVMMITLEGTSLSFDVIDIDGETLDAFTIESGE